MNEQENNESLKKLAQLLVQIEQEKLISTRESMFETLLAKNNIQLNDYQKLNTNEQRKIWAQVIIDNAELFKECCSCSSLIYHDVPVCHFCHNYQFETDRESVISQAKILMTKDEITTITDFS